MSAICTICLVKFTPNEEILFVPCGHIFHSNCIVQWLETGKNDCPQCRTACRQNQLRKVYLTIEEKVEENMDKFTISYTINMEKLTYFGTDNIHSFFRSDPRSVQNLPWKIRVVPRPVNKIVVVSNLAETVTFEDLTDLFGNIGTLQMVLVNDRLIKHLDLSLIHI